MVYIGFTRTIDPPRALLIKTLYKTKKAIKYL